jgi:hypothetical protein
MQQLAISSTKGQTCSRTAHRIYKQVLRGTNYDFPTQIGHHRGDYRDYAGSVWLVFAAIYDGHNLAVNPESRDDVFCASTIFVDSTTGSFSDASANSCRQLPGSHDVSDWKKRYRGGNAKHECFRQ